MFPCRHFSNARHFPLFLNFDFLHFRYFSFFLYTLNGLCYVHPAYGEYETVYIQNTHTYLLYIQRQRATRYREPREGLGPGKGGGAEGKTRLPRIGEKKEKKNATQLNWNGVFIFTLCLLS